MPVKRAAPAATPEAELKSSIAALDPAIAKLLSSVRTALRKQFPTANELVYNYSNSLVLSYSPTSNGIDAPIAVAARADGVFLYFNQGPKLSDPDGMLLGKGKQTRFVQLESAARLTDREVKAFIAASVAQARLPLPASGKGKVVIKTSAAKRTVSKKAPSKKAAKIKRAK